MTSNSSYYGSKKMIRVLVIGSATIDQVEQDGISTVKMGGVVIYGGITFRKHGLRTAVVSNIATQDEEPFRRIFRQQDIRLFNGVTETTTVFVNHVDVDRDERRQEMPVRAAPITADQAQPAIGSAYHVHLGPLHPNDIRTDLFKFVAEKKRVTLDVQGYVRRVEKGKVHPCISESLDEALAVSSVIKAEREELQEILSWYYRHRQTRQMRIEDLINEYKLNEVVVTAGREGGYVVSASGEVVDYKAPQVKVADTTGAGDVFFAAYLVSRLHERRSIRESCEHATGIAVRHVKGRYITEESLRMSW